MEGKWIRNGPDSVVYIHHGFKIVYKLTWGSGGKGVFENEVILTKVYF